MQHHSGHCGNTGRHLPNAESQTWRRFTEGPLKVVKKYGESMKRPKGWSLLGRTTAAREIFDSA